jgi:hypothetical protein
MLPFGSDRFGGGKLVWTNGIINAGTVAKK